MFQKTVFSTALLGIFLFLAAGLYAEMPESAFPGADAALDLFSPAFAGAGAFTTTQGDAPASALNPAAGGDAQRIVFNLGYLAIPGLGAEKGYGQVIEAGALFPTKYAVFGGSFRFIQSPFSSFPLQNTFGGNLNAAKELLPGMLVGLGLNFGFGSEWTLSGDLGFRYNTGKLGNLENFTWAAALRGLGKSWIPSGFTPAGGISFDLIHTHEEGKEDPIILNFSGDLAVPYIFDFSQISLTVKAGLALTLGEKVTVSASWPGAGGLNIRELTQGHVSASQFIPSIGVGLNIALKPSDKRIAGGRLPSDGNITADIAARPLYNNIWAFGGGVSWAVGVLDKNAPIITVDYPETLYISPNNDGKNDDLEFPVTITDQRYIASWTMEIKDSSGKTVRTYQNKERRPETQGVRNIISLLFDVKSGVEVPPSLRWDGVFESGDIAPDGTYTFTITAVDDNDNSDTSPIYTVMVDNTPPEAAVEVFAESLRIFSPDGDGNKDTFTIYQSGSAENRWDAGIYDAAGLKIRSFDIVNGSPAEFLWDGKDDEGLFVLDGVYSYRLSATDSALNSGSAQLDNIIVSTVQPAVGLVIADGWFSPNGDGIKDTLSFSPAIPVKEGITGWSLQIRDSRGEVQRTVIGGTDVPETLEFDGKNEQGRILNEGVYQGSLSIRYRNGYESTANSPQFILDVTPPSAAVQAGYSAFSPDNDGNQDEMIIAQSGSSELFWTGDIRRADAAAGERPVRSFRFQGNPTAQISWDGHGDAGTFAVDGEYTYQLYATDPAGNTGRSNTIRFSLSTADTPVMLISDLRAFSPNNDGVKDTLTLTPQIQVREGIASWKVDVLNSSGTAVRSFEGSTAVPASFSWNGRDTAGNTVPDGTYSARIELRYVQGNQPAALSTPFIVDTTVPKADITTPYTLFSPNNDGARDSIPLNVVTEGDDEWEGYIANAQGQRVRTWNWRGSLSAEGAPNLNWDGNDEAGNSVPDGTYQFVLSSTDEAGNSARLQIANISLDARIPRLILTTQVAAIAPKPGQAEDLTRFSVMVSPQDGIESWKLELKDAGGAVVKSFPAPQNAGQPQSAPPDSIGWNGLTEDNSIREGLYTPTLTVNYTKGDLANAQASPVMVDVSGPVLSFSSRPEYFSPDNDGVDDELIMSLGARDASPIASWSLEIREPQPPYQLFYRIEGRGSPSERLVWDGRSNRGELVQAATDYSYTFRAADTLGNSTEMKGDIKVDVLVIREGDRLRIQVPSIIFRENADDFNGLATETQDNNNRVLRRIAEILNKFRDYKITVEGHANPTTAPGTTARRAEETGSAREVGLQPLSEARARAVVNILVGFGVSRSRLSSVGMGGNQPVALFEDRNNWWKNRRVEFILIK